jgi:uncharacterized protein YdhG (YjbR/CyaY superfamily)
MKKPKSPISASPIISAATVDEYFHKVPEPALRMLIKLRSAIRKVVPAEATETISYGMPAFRYNGGLVCYAAFNNHCSLFPMGGVAVEKFKNELKRFETSKGTIRFPLDEPLPVPLIQKIVRMRVVQNKAKAAATKKR